MLVLSRKACQEILIPELDIQVEILKVSGNTVRLGIKAPKSIRIVKSAKPGKETNMRSTIAPTTVSTTASNEE